MKPKVIAIDGCSCIAVSHLQELGVPSGQIHQGIADYLNDKSPFWRCLHLKDRTETYIDIESLPPEIKRKFFSGPSDPVELKSMDPIKPLDGLQSIDLLLADQEGYQDFIHHYKHLNRKKRRRYAKKHAVLFKCIEMYIQNKGKRGTVLWLYMALKALKIIYYKNIQSFRRKIRELLNTASFEDSIINNRNGKSNHWLEKVTKWHKLKAMDLMSQGMLKTAILKQMNSECKPGHRISYTTLLKIIDREMENITAEDRYGYEFYKKHLEPYIRKEKPKYKFQVVEADGSRWQIPYYDSLDKKVRFLTIYVILDVFSSKVLAFSIDDEENRHMVRDAFWMLFEIHRLVPACIITDRSAPHRSKKILKLIRKTNKFFGTLWRDHLPDFPNAKGTVENFFFNFNALIVRNYPNYLGLSMKAKSKDHELRKDKVKQVYDKKEKLKSKSEMIHLITTLIHKWNTTVTKDKSPDQKYNEGELGDAKLISEELIAKLCWKRVKRKVDRSRIIMMNGEYSIESNKNRMKWNGSLVKVYYNPSFPDHIYIFKGDKFIEKCIRKRFYSEESGSKFSQISKNRSLRDYAKKRVKGNRKELRELEGTDPFFLAMGAAPKDQANEAHEQFLNSNIVDEHKQKEDETHDFDELPELNV